MNNLNIVVESMTAANKALREVIEKSADEVVQLERFEEQFRPVRDRYLEFKLTLLNNNYQADGVLARLEQTLHNKRQDAEDLRKKICFLKHQKEEQDEENRRLERDLDDNVDRLKSINLSNGNLSGSNWSTSPIPTGGKIINRLLEDTKTWTNNDQSG